MARARMMKPGFFRDEELAETSAWARLLFAGLWTIADRAGRLEDRSKRIKADVFPYDNVDIEALLSELATKAFIVRYEVGGVRFIEIPGFSKHQRPHPNEPKSEIPPASEVTKTRDIVIAKNVADIARASESESFPSESFPSHSGGGPGEENAADARQQAADVDGVASFPPKSPRFTPADVDAILAAYPRQVALRPARNPVEYALSDIARRPAPPADPVAWLLGRVQIFARSRAGQKGDKTPNPATWFSDARYDDDPAEWDKGGSTKDLEEQERQRKRESAAKALEESRIRRQREEAELKRKLAAEPDAGPSLKEILAKATRQAAANKIKTVAEALPEIPK